MMMCHKCLIEMVVDDLGKKSFKCPGCGHELEIDQDFVLGKISSILSQTKELTKVKDKLVHLLDLSDNYVIDRLAKFDRVSAAKAYRNKFDCTLKEAWEKTEQL